MKKKRFDINMPKGYSKPIHLVMIVLSIFGAIMVTSASMYGEDSQSLTVLIGKQFFFVFVSYVMMVFLARKFNWKWFLNPTLSLKLIMLFFIAFLIVPRFFSPVYGSYNWIRYGGITIQPSEISKPFIIAIIASTLGGLPIDNWMFDKKQLKKMSFFTQLKRVFSMIAWPFAAVVVMLGIVLFVQNDFGTFMIIFLIALTMVFMASHPFLTKLQRVLFIMFMVVGGIGIYLMTPDGLTILESLGMKQYQFERIKSLYTLFERDRVLSTSMQQVNGLLAFAKGGLTGNGLGSSILKYGYIPEQDSDYVLAILIDEFGFIGFLLISLGYLVLIMVLFRYAFKITHQPSRLYLIGVATYIFIHYLFNVGGTSGLIPLTGVPLLLISAGGSSQMGVFIAIGISQNIIARFVSSQKKKI